MVSKYYLNVNFILAMTLIMMLLPFSTVLILLLGGRYLGQKSAPWLAFFSLFLTMCLAWSIGYSVFIEGYIIQYSLTSWVNLHLLTIHYSIFIDVLVSSMLILITTVSCAVHLYSISYMRGDPHLIRFMAYLSLFTWFMMILVTSPNFLQLFIGWEGVGLCSYLLVNFWFTRIQATKAALKAMVMNRVGDLGLLFAMGMIYCYQGSLTFSSHLPLSIITPMPPQIHFFIGLLLLLAVMGKSAQLGLHMWLPDAMEGPTPVSALIHAATMVTAGVFLILRLSSFFEGSTALLGIMVGIGSLTAFFSALIGLTQNDVKKVIAYSTCSQLGYMVLICGFSCYEVGLFHLLNHGFFKALLFLSAGSLIHALHDEQDIRKSGGLILSNGFTFQCLWIGSLALMGLPFLTGFYSKDLLLEKIASHPDWVFGWWLALLSAGLTAFYSMRVLYYAFLHNSQASIRYYQKAHEGDWILLLPLCVLLILSLIAGYSFQYFILGDGYPPMVISRDKWGALYMTFEGAMSAFVLGLFIELWWIEYFDNKEVMLYRWSSSAGFVDGVVQHYILVPIVKLGFSITYKLLDSQVFEWWGPTGAWYQLRYMTQQITKFYQGQLSLYIYWMIFFSVLLILIF